MEESSLKVKWEQIVEKLASIFSDGDLLDVNSVIYLIGVQELGKGKVKLKKDDKVNVMHIAVCKILEPFGYYEFDFTDNDGWPHYKLKEELPNLKPGEQTILLKQAIIQYFESIEFI